MIYEPYAYQQYCTERLINEPFLGLFLEPGMRKTAITLTAINELRYCRWAVGKTLVVAPKKVAEATWQAEAKKWDHLKLLRISTVLGTAAQRERALATPTDIYVINRDNVTWLVEYYQNAWPFGVVILDESSSFKDSSTRRFKSLCLVRSRISRLVLLTGTPAANSLMDLWAQVYLLDEGERLGNRITHFRERFFYQNPYSRQYAPKDGSFEYIKKALGDICVSMEAKDYIDLPELMYNEIPVALDAAAAKAYSLFEKQMFLELEEGELNAGSACVLTGKLLQFCSGAVYDAARQVIGVHNCKIEALLEFLEGLGGQAVLVFYQFQHDRDRILAALAAKRKDLRVRVFKSAADQDDWNAGQIDLLLAHPMSCAYGLNLQEGGHHVLWFTPTWSLEQYEQANRRLYRSGQQQPVTIHHLVVQGGMDEDVIAALQGKREMQGALLEALRVRIKKAREGAM